MSTLPRAARRLATLTLIAAASAAHATEGGGLGTYPDGLENYLSGALPPPGVHALLYAGLMKYDKLRDTNGHALPVPGFGVDVAVLAPRIVWVTPHKVLGGDLAFHTVLPLLNVSFKATGTRWRSTGLGDITFGPALGFHPSPSLHYVLALDLIAPTGRYSSGDPSSPGKNHWTVQPVFAISTMEAAGLNADLKLMYDINQRNGATQTRSGQALHADYALGWGLGNGWVAGLGGHVFLQTTADSGPASAQGKARAIGLGPSLRYADGRGVLVTLKLQKEFSVRNRPEGTQFFVKAALPF